MDKKEHRRKIKAKLDLMARSAGRKAMPRPAVFKDRTKYDRNRQKIEDRRAQDADNRKDT